MSEIANIVLNPFTGGFVSSGAQKISIFAKSTTPQFSFYLWISQKGFFCTQTFSHSHRLSDKILWCNTDRYIDVLRSYFHSLVLTVLYFQYLSRNVFCNISHFFLKYPSAIFGCSNKVVSRIIDCMAHSFDGRAAYYTKNL